MNLGNEYNNKGYIILKDVYSTEEVDKIKSIVNELCYKSISNQHFQKDVAFLQFSTES